MKHTSSITIEVNGITYRRWPDSDNRNARMYWQCNITDDDGKYRKHYLHRDIWEETYGPIPEDMCIHHIDHDTLNNDLTNLTIMSKSEHMSMHQKELLLDENYKSAVIKRLNKIRVLGAAWQSSEEGKEYHRKAAKLQWENPTIFKCNCLFCKKIFDSVRSNGLYCSESCGLKYRRSIGKYMVAKQCEYCKKQYAAASKKTRFCSISCSNKNRANKASSKK